MNPVSEETALATPYPSQAGWAGVAFFTLATAAFLGIGVAALFTTFF